MILEALIYAFPEIIYYLEKLVQALFIYDRHPYRFSVLINYKRQEILPCDWIENEIFCHCADNTVFKITFFIGSPREIFLDIFAHPFWIIQIRDDLKFNCCVFFKRLGTGNGRRSRHLAYHIHRQHICYRPARQYGGLDRRDRFLGYGLRRLRRWGFHRRGLLRRLDGWLFRSFSLFFLPFFAQSFLFTGYIPFKEYIGELSLPSLPHRFRDSSGRLHFSIFIFFDLNIFFLLVFKILPMRGYDSIFILFGLG